VVFEVLEKLSQHSCKIATCCRNDWQLDEFAQQESASGNVEAVSIETMFAKQAGLLVSTGIEKIEIPLPVVGAHPRYDVSAPTIVHLPHF
jgi:hypothetical protein